MKYSGIGGQAVIEGVMMKGKSQYAVSVRKPDGQIEVKVEDYKSLKEKYAIAKLPIIRGIFAFAESLKMGMGTLNYSASFWEEEEEKEKEERGGKEGGKEENFLEKNTEAPLPSKRREWTNETLSELQPPTDGIGRNYDGLLYNMRLYGIPPMEQYAIIRKSNFGAIGGPVWKGFCALRDSCGKIKMPGRYLLSVMNR